MPGSGVTVVANATLRLLNEVCILCKYVAAICPKLRDDCWHGEVASINHTVRCPPRNNIVAVHARTPHANQIQTGNAIDLFRNTPRGNVDRCAGVPLHESAFSNSAELVNGSTAAHDDAIAYRDVTAKRRGIGHLYVIANLAVMPHM
jgi:hypothetical protein